MNPKLLIVTGLGLLKAYTLAFAPTGSVHVDRIKTVVLNDAHCRVVERAAGRRSVATQKDWSPKLETRRRLVKKIAELVEELIQEHSEYGVWLAAPQEINYLLAVTMQLGGKWMRCRFLRKARSEARAYPQWICKRRTTKSLRKKIEQTRPSHLHGYGLASALLKSVRQRIETNLTLDLGHFDEKELLEYFAPQAIVKSGKK